MEKKLTAKNEDNQKKSCVQFDNIQSYHEKDAIVKLNWPKPGRIKATD